MSNLLRNIFFFIGLAAVVIMLLTFDVSFTQLWQQITSTGYLLPLIALLWLVLYVMNALTWHTILLGSGEQPVPFLKLLKITISGFALNYATPAGLLGGEPYKILELKPYVGLQRATSSVLLFAMMHIYSHFWYWLTGVVLMLLIMPLNIPLYLLLACITLFCAAAIYLFLKGYKNGLVVRLTDFISRIPGLRSWSTRFVDKHKADLQPIDTQIAALHGQNRRSFYITFFLEYFGRVLQSFEIFLLLILLADAPPTFRTFALSLIILAFTSLLANMLFFLPLQLGGREGGFALSIAAVGFSGAVSMGVSLLVRVRELFWTLLGILLIKIDRTRQPKITFGILAAGEGSRLHDEGITTPKPLVRIGGETLLHRLVRIFMTAGATDIAVVINSKHPEVELALKQMQAEGKPIRYIVRDTPGSMHSFYELMPLLGKGKFCVTTVDTVFDEQLFLKFIHQFSTSAADGLMTVTDYVCDESPLWVQTSDDLKITGFMDKGQEDCRYISGGIYALDAKSFTTLCRLHDEGAMRMRNFQRSLIADGFELHAVPMGRIFDIDHRSDIYQAENQITGIIAISRDPRYSPGSVDADAAILQAVAEQMETDGLHVAKFSEAEFCKYFTTSESLQGVKLIFGMYRDEKTLQLLDAAVQMGIRVVPEPAAIRNARRVNHLSLLRDNHVPIAPTLFPPHVFPISIKPPFWLKSAHGWTQTSSDIIRVSADGSASSHIPEHNYDDYVIQQHIEGQVIKFYGVLGTAFFKTVGPEPSTLKNIATKSAEALSLPIYGGDAVVAADGQIHIIDFNDWPSFSCCRNEAAENIKKILDSHAPTPRTDDETVVEESTLYTKSSDTEEWFDMIFNRPLGYIFARMFAKLGVHPNVVTVISIMFGASGAFLFHYDLQHPAGLLLNIIGVILFVLADILDSTDGQLARMTGQKTQFGRILDGASGDIWFIIVYISIAIRLSAQPFPDFQIPMFNIQFSGTWGLWAWALVLFSGLLCHAPQCRMADYYRSIHLWMLGANSTLDRAADQWQTYHRLTWRRDPIQKFFYWTYAHYTARQERSTPKFQQLYKLLNRTPSRTVVDRFIPLSRPLMKYANIITFNTRAFALYIAVLTDNPWFYPAFEITVLSAIYFYLHHSHETISEQCIPTAQ